LTETCYFFLFNHLRLFNFPPLIKLRFLSIISYMKWIVALLSFLLLVFPFNSYSQLKEEKNEDPFKFNEQIIIPQKYQERFSQEKTLKKNLPSLTQAEKISWTFRTLQRQILL